MNQHPQRQPAPAPIPTASTPAEARKLAENLMEVMSALLGVIERETELVRAGKMREAMAFGAEEDRTVAPLCRRDRASEGQPEISAQDGAGAADHAASPSRHVSRHAADQPHRARDRACGIRKHRARRQHRDAAPQHSQHLHRRRTARGAGTAAHHAAGGQPLALNFCRRAFSQYEHFSSNLRAAVSATFSAFSNTALRGAGHSCVLRGVGI